MWLFRATRRYMSVSVLQIGVTMGSKTFTKRRLWSNESGSFDGNPPVRNTFAATEGFTRVGYDLPKFRSLIKDGASATTSLRVDVSDVFYKKGYAQIIGLKNPYLPKRQGQVISSTYFGHAPPVAHTTLPGSLLRASVDNSALIGIIKKIRDHRTSGLSGPTFLGEFRETIKMLRSPVQALRQKTNLFTDLQMRINRDKTARGKKAEQKWADVIAGTYLEWTFGAKPLLSDIEGILEIATEMKSERLGTLKRLSHTHSDSYNVSEGQLNATWPGTGFVAPYQQWASHKSSSNYVVWIDESLIFADGPMDRLRQLARFDLDEIIPTAWELMPWSFLIDYFTNIGDVLGCTFNYNRDVAFAKRTLVNQVIKFHAPGKPRMNEAQYYGILEFEPWTYTSSYKRIEREAISKLGFPSLEVSLPSVGQSLNIAALFVALSQSNPFRGFTLK